MEFISPQERFLLGFIFYSPAIIAFVFGAIIGSLSNVIIYRMPYYRSIWSPSSHCTTCGTEIPGYLNIPLVSYLVLRGRCKYCGSRFTSRYFWVELTSGLLYALIVIWVYTLPPNQGMGIPFTNYVTFNFKEMPTLAFPMNPLTLLLILKGFIFSSFLLILSMIDLEHRLLPDRITFPGIIIALLLSVVAPHNRPEIASLGTSGWLDAVLQSIIGLIVGGGVLFIIAKIVPAGMGWGDVKLLAMIGAFVGIKSLGAGIFLGFVIGGLVGGIVMVTGIIGNMTGSKKKYVPFKTYIPFGPFLAIGGLISFLIGPNITSWYLMKFAATGGTTVARHGESIVAIVSGGTRATRMVPPGH